MPCKESKKRRGCVLFIIPKANDYLDPVCDPLFDLGFTPVILHHGKTIDNHHERLNKIISDFGEIVCAVFPDDLCFCDEWLSNVQGNIQDLVSRFQERGIPIVSVAMEWRDHIFDERVEIENTGAAFEEILKTVKKFERSK